MGIIKEIKKEYFEFIKDAPEFGLKAAIIDDFIKYYFDKKLERNKKRKVSDRVRYQKALYAWLRENPDLMDKIDKSHFRLTADIWSRETVKNGNDLVISDKLKNLINVYESGQDLKGYQFLVEEFNNVKAKVEKVEEKLQKEKVVDEKGKEKVEKVEEKGKEKVDQSLVPKKTITAKTKTKINKEKEKESTEEIQKKNGFGYAPLGEEILKEKEKEDIKTKVILPKASSSHTDTKNQINKTIPVQNRTTLRRSD